MTDEVRMGNLGIAEPPSLAGAGEHAAVCANAKRGFAAMDSKRQREIASKGGRAAHESGTAHEFDSDEAREAGRLGGRAVSRDRAHMAEIGRAGGKAKGRASEEEAPRVSPLATEVEPSKGD